MRTRFGTLGALAFALLWTAPAMAQDWQHGSGSGKGTSRGPGTGDGLGRVEKAPADEPEPEAANAEDDGEDLDAPVVATVLDEVKFIPTAEYRVRWRHTEGKDFLPGNSNETFRHRARAGVTANWQDRLGVFAQVQDVRYYGEETGTATDFSADGFDMHQAYAFFTPLAELEMRLGRQEISLANQRLVGALDWQEQARTFDGVRFMVDASDVNIDAFYAKLSERALQDQDANPASRHLAGLTVDYPVHAAFHPHIIGITDRTGNDGKRQHTVGALFKGNLGEGIFTYSTEAYFQFGVAPVEIDGPPGDVNYVSYLFAADTRVTLVDVTAKPYLGLQGTVVSGDDNPRDNTIRTFEHPFATAHKFYGEMDFFLDLPNDTDGRGLRDIATSIGIAPVDKMDIHATHHLFEAMAGEDDLTHFGHELDVRFSYKFWKYAYVGALYGVFFPGVLKEREAPDADPEHFAASTVGVKF